MTDADEPPEPVPGVDGDDAAGPRQIASTLELISPVLPGRLFELIKDTVRIGRDPGSDILLNRKDVSWSHAWVRRLADGYHVEDRESRNGTIVNGARLEVRSPRRLEDGDRIKICDNVLIFRREAVKVEARDAGSTVLGTLENLTSLDVVSSVSRPEDVLRAVLEINRNLGGILELNEALGRTLDTLFGIFKGADRGFILTVEGDDGLHPRAIRQRGGGAGPLTLSRTALDHVMHRAQGILTTEPAAASGEPRTILSAPLLDRDGRAIGIIQLVSRPGRVGFRPDDLDLLAAVAVPIGVAVENHHLLRSKAEWAAAGEVQRALLPRRQPRAIGYDFWEHYEPAQEVGGDYYDYIPIHPADPGADRPWLRWAVAAGDVVGKGMPAALLMSGLSAEVRNRIRTVPEPALVVEQLNRHYYDADILDRFITFLLIVVDADVQRMTVVNAGHLLPFVRRASGRIDALGADDAGPPLGVLPSHPYRSTSTDLAPGDVVLLFTDGVSEALGAENRQFGTDAIRATLAAAPAHIPEIGQAVLAAVRAHTSGRPQSDDIAIVCFGRQG